MRNSVHIIILMLSAWLLSSCEMELDVSYADRGQDYFGQSCDTVSVFMQISSAGEAATRSSVSPSEDRIADYSVFIYQKGRLVQDVFMNSREPSSVTLHLGQTYSVYALANVGNLTAPDSESELKELAYMTAGISSLGSTLPMAQDYGEVTVTAGTSFSFVVERLVSRISFSLDALAVTGLKVSSVKLRQAPVNVYPFAEGGSRASVSDVADGDYASEADITALNKGGSVVFYVLENRQGTLLSGNTDPWSKVPDNVSGASACTYIEAVCTFTQSVDGREGTVTYRMYLGNDNVTNFDIVRNTQMQVALSVSEGSLDAVSWKVVPDYTQHVTSLSVSPGTLSIMEGESSALEAAVFPADADDLTVLWESSDPRIASVNDKGVVTAVKEGTCTVTARSNDMRDIYDVCSVTVTPAYVYEYELTPTSVVSNEERTGVYYHQYKQMSLKRHKIRDGEEIEVLDVTATAVWASSDEAVFTVEKGKLYGNSNGTAYLSVSHGDFSKTIKVLVRDEVKDEVVCNIDELTVAIGHTLDLSERLSVTWNKYVNGILSESADVTQHIDFEPDKFRYYYSIDEAGVLTGLRSTIYREYEIFLVRDDQYIYGAFGLSVNVVDDIYYELEVTPGSSVIDAGSSCELKAVYYEVTNGVRDSGTDVTSQAVWSSDSSCATVSSGIVTGVNGGTAAVTAAYEGLTASASVTVKDRITYDYRFFISGYNSVIAGQSTGQYLVYYYKDTYTNGTLTSQGNSALFFTDPVTWTLSAGNSFGTISSAGILTGTAKGTVTIKASVTFEGRSFECFKDVTVTQASGGGPDTGWEDGGDVDYD